MIRPEDLKHFQRTNHHSHQNPRQVHHIKQHLIEHLGIHGHLVQVLDPGIHRTIRQHEDPAPNPRHRHHDILQLQNRLDDNLTVSIRPRYDQEHVTHVMYHQNEDPDHPEVHHVREEDQEHR